MCTKASNKGKIVHVSTTVKRDNYVRYTETYNYSNEQKLVTEPRK
jgi:hypothetical protein